MIALETETRQTVYRRRATSGLGYQKGRGAVLNCYVPISGLAPA
ncbi:uncharacterized protein METZ01_LOCUS283094, partial [marine metagenome]